MTLSDSAQCSVQNQDWIQWKLSIDIKQLLDETEYNIKNYRTQVAVIAEANNSHLS